jgi:hypothetical protein
MRILQDSFAIYSNNPKQLGEDKQKMFKLFFEIVELRNEPCHPEHPPGHVELPAQSSMHKALQALRLQGKGAAHHPQRVIGFANN